MAACSVKVALLTSQAFRTGLDATGRNYLVSTGRFALRGIGRAQNRRWMHGCYRKPGVRRLNSLPVYAGYTDIFS